MTDKSQRSFERDMQPPAVCSTAEPVYVISVVAQLLGVHAQTLRHYERIGLLEPARSGGNVRLYSDRDVERLRLIIYLTGQLGINLAGVEQILEMRDKIGQLETEVNDLKADMRMVRGYLLEDQARRSSGPG
jgi:MerR family transcriptional regulator/heat shock protein HspR